MNEDELVQILSTVGGNTQRAVVMRSIFSHHFGRAMTRDQALLAIRRAAVAVCTLQPESFVGDDRMGSAKRVGSGSVVVMVDGLPDASIHITPDNEVVPWGLAWEGATAEFRRVGNRG